MMDTIKKVLSLLFIFLMILPISLPVISKAVDTEENITLNIELQRDETNPNLVHITATDSQYNITDLKYVHQYIETNNIDYFEQNNSDVYTFDIDPAHTISETFELDGYGSYSVYARNERGERFLARLTVNDPNDMPQITLTKDEENPLILTIQVTSDNYTITRLKIAKKENIDDKIDFSIQGTDIQFEESNNVTVRYTNITEEGLYVVYAEDSEGNRVTRQIYLAEENTPISVEFTESNNPREVNLQITDAICNIVAVKVAKLSDVSDFDDFDTVEALPIKEGRNVNVTYQAPEDDTYVFYIEDEAGYRLMTQRRITEEENNMQVNIEQDENSPGNLTITATNSICNIVEMKVAIGNDITMDYFENNGDEITIEPGKEVVGRYTVNENCTINVYVRDEQGYSYIYTRTLIGIDEPEPNEPPEITLTQNENNPRQINVIVRDEDSTVDQVKWAKGNQTIGYFATNGTRIGQGIVGNVIRTQFTIDDIGTYTVYASDDDGNEIVETIEITSIDETPVEPDRDVTPPTIQTTNEIINQNEAVRVSIHIKDTESQIANVKMASGVHDIAYFENEGTVLRTINDDKSAEAAVMITQNGSYTIYAEDEFGNRAIEVITISEIEIPEPEPEPDDTITSSQYEIYANTIDRILPNTNVSTFRNNISTEVEYRIVDSAGTELQSTDIIGTGYRLITDTGKEYTLIVTGDLNGDGSVTLTDISRIRKYYLEIEDLQNIYEQAADMNHDNTISLNDISIMRKVYLDIQD